MDRLRTSKEVAKAVLNAELVTAELNASLASHGVTDPDPPTGPNSGDRLAAAQARVDELLAAAQALEQELRADPFLGPRLAPHPTPDRRPRPDQIQFHEQVWATVLHQRGMTQRLVATVFGISPATVKRTVKTITPLLERDGTTITPSPRRLHHLIHLSRYFTPMPSTQP